MPAQPTPLTAEVRIPLISDLIDVTRDVGPSVGVPMIMLAVGFAIGIWGHAARSPKATAFGIMTVFVASILFFLGSASDSLDEGDLPSPRIDEQGRPFRN